MTRADKMLLALWVTIAAVGLALAAVWLSGCYPSLIGKSGADTIADRIEKKLDELNVAGSTTGGDRLSLPSGEGGGESLEPRQDSVIPPSAPPVWSERWFWETLGGVGFALATGYVKRKQSLANRALERVVKTIEPRRSRNKGGTVDDVVNVLKAWSSVRGDAASKTLHAAVKRATK